MPVDMLYEQLIYPQLEKCVGDTFKIAHLKSERGRLLNGKTCRVTGYDRNTDPRLHCQIINDNNNNNNRGSNMPIGIKYQNLIPLDGNEALEHFMSNSTPISDDTLATCLESAIQKHNFTTDRQDLQHRLSLYKSLLDKIRNPTEYEMQDTDYCLPCGAGSELLNNQDNFGRLMQMTKPGCFSTGEVCDIRYIDIGLKGDDETECSICHEILTCDTSQVIVTLPCLHVYHENCIQNWLGSDLGQQNWNCPTCRKVVPGDMSIYCINYHEQLQRRIDEYPLSGFCTKCMIMIMENNRHESLPIVT